MPGNPDFPTSLAAMTFDLVQAEIHDNITDNQILLWDLKRRGFEDKRTGGLMIDYIVELGENSGAASYADGALLSLEAQNPHTRVRYDWKFYSVPTTITGPSEFKNSGDKPRIYSLVDGLADNAEKSLQLLVNADLYGTGSNGTSIIGLALAVENGAAWSSYGGIDSSGATAEEIRWRNGWIGTVGSFAANGRRQITSLINNITKRGKGGYPTLNLTTNAIATELELSMTINEKYEMSSMKDEAMAKAGFQHFMFKGIPTVWDTDCTSGAFYSLNASGLRWIVGKDFAKTPFVHPDNQDAKSRLTLLYCALVTTARYKQGVADGITTP